MTLQNPQERREIILALETSTSVCSVALHNGCAVIAEYSCMKKNTHAEIITTCVEHLLKMSRIAFSELSAIAISLGPGSYTGLRIGLSTAKGLCFALKIPIIGIDTLEAMAWGMRKFIPHTEATALLCPMLDARRIEVYTLLMSHDTTEIHLPTCALVVDEESFSQDLRERRIVFFGDGAEKCEALLGKNKNATFIPGIYPSARNVVELAYVKKQHEVYEDLSSLSPIYLKEFGEK